MNITEIIMAVLTAIVIPFLPKLFKLLSALANKNDMLAKTQIDDLAFKYLEEIVSGVTMPLAKKYKDAMQDGKLTDDEKSELRTFAFQLLKEEGKRKGIDFAKKIGPTILDSILRKVVAYVKNRGS